MPEEKAVFPDHEHRFKLTRIQDGASVQPFQRLAWYSYRCVDCGAAATVQMGPGRTERPVGPAKSYLHTCSNCGRQYRDAHPLAGLRAFRGTDEEKFCSEACSAAAKERWRKEDALKLIPTLERMVKDASDEGARTRARERLEGIAADTDAELRREAKAAIDRLSKN